MYTRPKIDHSPSPPESDLKWKSLVKKKQLTSY